MGDGVGNIPGLFLGSRLLHLYLHQLGSALAISHDGSCQLHADRLHGLSEQAPRLAAGITRIHAGGSAGHQHAGIVGGGVAIHGDGIEGWRDSGLQHLPQTGAVTDRVRGHIGQHGGHIRTDHARALAHAGDGNGAAIHLEAATGQLGHGIRGHDGPRGPFPVVFIQP